MEFLEKLYKDSDLKNEEININLRKLFALSFTRVYLKIFIDWIDKNKFIKDSEITEIIKVINGEENNTFRNMPLYFICKILYNNNMQDISILFDNKIYRS